MSQKCKDSHSDPGTKDTTEGVSMLSSTLLEEVRHWGEL